MAYIIDPFNIIISINYISSFNLVSNHKIVLLFRRAFIIFIEWITITCIRVKPITKLELSFTCILYRQIVIY
jgi:hypothetical protein